MAGPERINLNISLTTVQGILSGALAFSTALLPSYPKFATPALAIIGALKIAVGTMQKDAGQQEAIPPGGDKPELMPSHETPNQVGAEVVK